MLDLRTMHGNDPDAISFPADGRAVAVAVAAAHAFAARAQIGDDASARLAIVVEELVTNLVEHGDAPGAPIDMAMAKINETVHLCIVDRGTPFDLRGAVASDLPPERGGGAGLLLVLAWTKVEAYERVSGLNRLTMSLALSSAG